MFLLMRVVAVSLVLLMGLAQSSVAQSNDFAPQEVLSNLLEGLRIDEIAEDQVGVRVRASRTESNGRSASGVLIFCGPGYVAVHDPTSKTDDRWSVQPGFCEALLTTVRQRKDAQEP